MKQLRFWLLVVLIALLPIRGAMAAAMLCGPAGAGSQIEQPVMSPDHHEHHGHHDDRGAEAHGAHHGHDQGQGGDASQDNKCTMCSAFCSATPLLSALPTLPGPATAAVFHFPALDAPAPTFLSDGQERPPRSI